MWEKLKGWFKYSLTIFWARLQYIGGALVAGAILVFANYDYTKLLDGFSWEDILHMLGAVIIAAIITEITRRRTL